MLRLRLIMQGLDCFLRLTVTPCFLRTGGKCQILGLLLERQVGFGCYLILDSAEGWPQKGTKGAKIEAICEGSSKINLTTKYTKYTKNRDLKQIILNRKDAECDKPSSISRRGAIGCAAV